MLLQVAEEHCDSVLVKTVWPQQSHLSSSTYSVTVASGMISL